MHLSFAFYIFLQSHLQMHCKDRTLDDIALRIVKVDMDLKRISEDNGDRRIMNRKIILFELIAVIVTSICFVLISIYDLIVFQQYVSKEIIVSLYHELEHKILCFQYLLQCNGVHLLVVYLPLSDIDVGFITICYHRKTTSTSIQLFKWVNLIRNKKKRKKK